LGREKVVAVTVVPGVERQLEEQGTVTLLIRSPEEPGRVAAAVGAAANDIAATGLLLSTGEAVIAGEVIRSDGSRWRPTDQDWEDNEQLWELDGPSWVSGPVPVPGGQVLTIDYKCTAPQLCRETPRLLIQHLGRERVQEAEISFAPRLRDEQFTALRSFSPVVRANLRAGAEPREVRRFTDLPQAASLIDVAAEWIRSHHEPGMDLLAMVSGSTEIPLTWDNLRPVIDDVLTATISVELIVSDFATRAATAGIGFMGYMGITLAAAGRDWRGEQAVAQMRALRETIRARAADASWAGIEVYPSTDHAEDVLLGVYHSDELHAGPRWYHLLSDAQLRRLSAPPPGAAELPNGRLELTTGEPEQWLPGHPDNAAVRTRASKLLSPDPGSGET
jgi:hypothetical protein